MGREGTSGKGWDGGWGRFKLFFVSYYLLSFFLSCWFLCPLFLNVGSMMYPTAPLLVKGRQS